MDNEDGPNFSYAYGGTSASSASTWNPALRPDHEDHQSAVPITKPTESSSEAAPQPQLPVETGLRKEEHQEDALLAPPAPAIAAPESNNIFDAKPNADDDFFDRPRSDEAPDSIPQPLGGEINGHGVSGAEEEALANGLQGLDLKDKPSEDVNGAPHDLAEAQDTRNHYTLDASAPEEHAAENYEHQGEGTLLEKAVIESDKVPLVQDAEPATDDWGASGEVFDLGGKPQDALLPVAQEPPLPTPQAEAVGTTVGDEVIGNTKVGGNTGEEIDWGTGDTQDFFSGGNQPGSLDEKAATGTDSAWDLALDDDFLPDNDEAPAPFELDDEGFLEDEPPASVRQPGSTTQTGSSTTNRYAPQAPQVPQPTTAASPYGLQGPQFTDFSKMDQRKPMATPNVAYGGYGQPSSYQQQATRPTMPSSAQSFADKAKTGYSSPYDLPEDVVTTRRRPAARPAGPTVQPTPPPPRTSSMHATPGTAAPRPPPPSNMSTSSLSPPSSSHSNQSPMTGMPPYSKPALSKQQSTEFFAELPVTSKPKPSGRYTPQQSAPQHPQQPHAPPQLLPKERTSSWSSLRNEVLPDGGHLASQLRQPEQLPVFPDQPSVPVRSNSLPVPTPVLAPASVPSRYSPQPPPAAPPAPTANTRYSPAPPAAPAPNTRYSPAPPPQGPAHNRYASEPSTGSHRPPQPYAPRTSSPLAFHTVPQDQQEPHTAPEQATQHFPSHHTMHSADSVPRVPYKSPLEGVSEADEQGQTVPQHQGPPITARSETPPLRSNPSSTVGSPRKRSNYTPQYQHGTQATTSGVLSPSSSQSQSPESTMKHASFRHISSELSGLAYGSVPISAFAAQDTTQSAANVIPHKRQVSHDFECIAPTDERAVDPLQRWKGYPIFQWGLGGTIVTSFPKQIPRYGGGASMPMMKCSPGEVKIQNIKEALPLPEEISKFPGPLKAKGKKKDVSAWLGRRIETLENQLKTPGFEHTVNPDVLKRYEEKVLLWKLLQVLVDNDGHLEGNATAEAAVRNILSPEGADSASGPDASFSTAADLVGISRSNTSTLQSEPVDPRAIEELRTLLTKGDREKAVWHAVDKRLWAHAMLLSSTLNKDVWKQVVQEFVRKEVKKVGRNNQALAVLYEIFAGNWEDCIDELVPASARAGFQMVSTDGAGTTQNALQGLDKWRETLSLVLNNRSTGDTAALLSLGRLLAGYGRVEAAHICFIFARSATYLGGVDDAQSDLVLVGADHRADPLSLGHDMEPVLLTEVYEFALSLSTPGGSHVIPHLQNYKLAHAYTLAENGYRTDAQAYCDAIASAMKSTTKISPYYNGAFIASLDDLSKRLSQSPKDGSSSWISKPSMDKVSSSLLSKFNSFIAGDDEDVASTHSAEAVGPFAKIAGNTPNLSPTHSSADLYGAYSGYGGTAAPPSAPVNSRYAPSNAYAPRTSSEQARSPYEPQGRPSMESQPSNPYLPSPSLSGPYTPSQPQFSPPSQRTDASKAHTYAPLKAPAVSTPYGSPYQPTPPADESTPSFGGYHPPQASFDDQLPSPPAETGPASGGYEPPSMGGYEPPTSSFEPPSYQPYDADKEESPVEPKKKKSFMDDDDDDFAARAAALKSKQKSEADRKADEAFRKAAEADAQRDKEVAGGKKGGWFGGWFKKDPNAAPGPIKAKLGEESSFYYDPELKKWVNKKAGPAEASKPMATPPPPKSGPPSRSVSNTSAPGIMGPPSSLPNAMSAPPSRAPTSNPPRSSSMPPPMSGPQSRASTPGIPSGDEGSKPPVLMPPNLSASGPPSRPSTGMSNASSIDDLLGAPTAKKGTVKGKKRGGRYVDVMAQK